MYESVILLNSLSYWKKRQKMNVKGIYEWDTEYYGY